MERKRADGIKRFAAAALALWLWAPAELHALSEPLRETFDSIADGATVNGVQSWTVPMGAASDATAEAGDTVSGTGKALQLAGTAGSVQAARPDNYGSLSPTWIEYVVKPAAGGETRDIPEAGIAAVDFSPTGDIRVADGNAWMKTGKTYTLDTWYRVILKLDFSTHMYSIYLSPASTPKTPFVPDKENLHFIDSTISSMSELGFYGAYDAATRVDSKVDEVIVHTIEKLQFISSPQTLVKGYVSDAVTVQLQNANSEPQTAWTDLTVELRASTTTGEFSLSKDDWAPVTSVILPEGAQQVTVYYKDFKEGRPIITANEYPDRGWTDAEQEEKIVSEGEYFSISTTTPQVAGKLFNIQIAAKDSEGGIDTSYGGSVDVLATYVDPVTGSKILVPDTADGFVNGVKEMTLSYADAGTIKIVVRDKNETSKVGVSGDILFLPDSFAVSSDAVQIVGKNFPLIVQALSAEGQPAPNYRGPAKLEAVPVNPATSNGSFNPATVTAQFENGTAAVESSYNRWGLISIKAFDQDYPERKGLSAPVSFVPKSLSVSVKPPSASRSFFYANENMEITLSVLADDGMPIENFQGNISITATPSLTIPASYAFTTADKGQKVFTVPAGPAGIYKLKMQDVGENLSVESEPIEVKDATITISSTSAPVGTTVVEIQLVDSKGKRITSENEMRVTIIISEEVLNASTFFSDAGKPIVFKNGVAKVVIGNTEAETVEISAKSVFGLKVVNGRVVFGHAGATGVGALMLRETKD